ncbi:hypothetical protein KL918_005095 [Ogataea parapolymorpha]|uniref:DH domain-containing protein n=1 Tax=Ogataea parapolymorpha (strain ATCC 26012 / BCRC 20466 / JCM 22074 / NRRL Y-7560 / DL-1) TaxID=871575 RepID=W1QJJ7_OGAPD|nr:hypothetical protein HPODL_04808 [Ogataea parapolymorpha DL-1]ESX02048.1 hypothetical protein HPODL_04808 [Ogataea parapolymorpha DL-1]KAG7864969.1 hypothetical protein KL918_005095 [Ogataea parapolymorpha]KAG7871528.1 hypothetical protein KL916_003879 [Ogataea parapolymorpha]
MSLIDTDTNTSKPEPNEEKHLSDNFTLASVGDSTSEVENYDSKPLAALDYIDLRFDSSSSITVNTPAPLDLNSGLEMESLEGPETCLLTPVTPVKKTSSSAFKRSFTRQKQIKELLNTEEVYVKSLKVLKEVYVSYLGASEPIPLFFENFASVVDSLLEEHTRFLKGLVSLYREWVKSGNSAETSRLSIHSPMFETHVPRSEDLCYLEKIVDWIHDNSINVRTYSAYCQLVPKVIIFAEAKNVHQYNTSSIVIYNDYMVEHQDVASSYFLQQQLDIRFISLVQMPTNRISRYKLIVDSLLQKSKGDIDSRMNDKLESCVKHIADKCTQINNHVGRYEKIELANQQLKTMMSSSLKRISDDPYFFDNMGDVIIVAAFATVWSHQETIKYEYFGSILFDSHLVLVRPYKHRQLGVKMIIPVSSIFNIQDSDLGAKGLLFTIYPHCFKIQFEYNFKQFEIVVILPSESEKQVWLEKLREMSAKWRADIGNQDFAYSFYKRKHRLHRSELEKFRFRSFIPDDITPFREKSHGQLFALEASVRQFSIHHFNPYPDESLRRDRFSSHNVVVAIKKEDRVRVEKSLGDLWASEIPKTTVPLTRSISDFSLRKKLSISSISSLNNQNSQSSGPRSTSLMRGGRSGTKLSTSSSMRNLAHTLGNMRSTDEKDETVSGDTETYADHTISGSGSIRKSFSFKKLIKSLSVHSNMSELENTN